MSKKMHVISGIVIVSLISVLLLLPITIKPTDKIKTYSLIATLNDRQIIRYIDRNVKIDETYTYKMLAVSKYGIDGEFSDISTVCVGIDEEPPIITSITPSAAIINKFQTISIKAIDNMGITKLTLEYKKSNTTDWVKIGENSVIASIETTPQTSTAPQTNPTTQTSPVPTQMTNSQISVVNGTAQTTSNFKIDTTTIPDGSYTFRAIAYDGADNASAEFTKAYEIDNTGIAKIILKPDDCTPSSSFISLRWEDVSEPDFSYFAVEKMNSNGTFIETIRVYNTAGAHIQSLLPETAYTFRVVGYDKLGNRGEVSDEITLTTISDTVSPIITTFSPLPLAFSNAINVKVTGTDNVGIKSLKLCYSYDKGEEKTWTDLTAIETTNGSFYYTWDTSALPEGDVFLQAQIFDTSGNKSSTHTNNYKIDHTAPNAPDNLLAVADNGRIHLTWDTLDNDVVNFEIYRAEQGKGDYVKHETINKFDYYDNRNLNIQSAYTYKIIAIDLAGNKSPYSLEVTSTVNPDTEKPQVIGFNEKNGATISPNMELSVIAKDNNQLSKVLIAYKPSENNDWINMAEYPLTNTYDKATFTEDMTNMSEGNYSLKAIAYDEAGNESDPLIYDYILDKTPPTAPTLTLTPENRKIKLTMTGENPADFACYKIYRRASGEAYKLVGNYNKTEYTDRNLDPTKTYFYKIESYDKAFNFSTSNEVSKKPLDIDDIAPIINIANETTTMDGFEFILDASRSTDNVKIASYTWDMGDGVTKNGENVTYKYPKTGDYTVTLTVKDTSDNTSTTTINVKVADRVKTGTKQITVTDKNGVPISYAYVYIKGAQEYNLIADAYGRVSFSANIGTYTLNAYKEGYLPAKTTFEMSSFGNNGATSIALEKGEIITGELTSHRMTLDEMKERGIDINDPDNYNVFEYTMQLTFSNEAASRELKFVANSNTGKMLSDIEPIKVGTATVQFGIIPTNDKNKPIIIQMTTDESISFMKDMYSVDLTVKNNAATEFSIKDAAASLNVPYGLTLVSGDQTQDIGEIKGQETKSVSWAVRGDKKGEYHLEATFNGTLVGFNRPINYAFKTKDPIKVTAGEGLHLYVMPEKAGYPGADYYIKYKLVNEGDHDFYNVSASFTGKKVEVFKVGESISGVKVTKFMEMGYLRFDLINAMVKDMTKDMDVEVTIEPIPSHVTIAIAKLNQAFNVPGEWGDPVDTTTGAFIDDITAIALNTDTPVTFELSYNSLNGANAGQVGYGWTHNYESKIEDEGDIINFYINNTNFVTFAKKSIIEGNTSGGVSGETFIPITTGAKDYKLERLEDIHNSEDNEGEEEETGTRDVGTNEIEYLLTDPNGNKQYFDQTGKLIKKQDRNGRFLTIDYMTDNNFPNNNENADNSAIQKTIITEPITGETLTLTHNQSGFITSAKDKHGRAAYFTYQDGQMTTATNPVGDSIAFTYDDKNQMISYQMSADTKPFVTNVYDENGRVITQYDIEGNVIEFSYTENPDGTVSAKATDRNNSKDNVGFTVNDLGQILGFKDQNGSEVTYEYDNNGRLVNETDQKGNLISYAYDSKGNLSSARDENGSATAIRYDSKGNIVNITDTGGNYVQYTYNKNNLKSSEQNRSGVLINYAYNDFGQLISEETVGLGTKYYHYISGRVDSVIDYLGNKTNITYDEYGNVKTVTDRDGYIKSYTYDIINRVISMTDESGTERYAYDSKGNKESVTDKKGNVTYRYRNNQGLVEKEVDAKGNVTKYLYDNEGRLIKTENPDGTSYISEYDKAGNEIRTVNEKGEEEIFVYDETSLILEKTDANGTEKYDYYQNGAIKTVIAPNGSTTTYEYDAGGRTTKIIDFFGDSTIKEYDFEGRVISITDAESNTTSYTYDKYGRTLTTTDPNGNITSYEYDANDNLIKTINALGEETGYEYTNEGRLIKTTIAGNSVSYEYDSAGRVIKTTDQEGNTHGVTYDANGNTIDIIDANGDIIKENTYNELNQLISTKDALGAQTQLNYDVMGNLKTKIDYLNTESQAKTDYSYDAIGQLLKVIDAESGKTEYTYDGAHNLIKTKDQNGGIIRYSYDSLGNVTQTINQIGAKHTYTYNAVGLLTESKNARNQATEYTYYKNGWINTVTDALGTITYTYDNNGNVLTVTDKNGVITREYDALNRVTKHIDTKDNVIKYAYDEAGNLKTLTYPDNKIVKYTYYKNGLLKSVTDYNNLTTTYNYDTNARLIKTSRPNATTETRTYDILGRLTNITDKNGEQIITQLEYTYDAAGNISDTSDTIGVTIDGIESVTMEYDSANRLISYNGEQVKYDADGNMTYAPLAGTMTTFKYDCRNRLIQAGNATFKYDAENNRISKTEDEINTNYVVENAAQLSRILIEETGTNKTYYTYGNGLISQEKTGESISPENHATLYYHFNNIGSTVAVTDTSGEIIERFNYGTYGELQSENQTGITFLYNGEYGVVTDNNGLYYMRARYYNPAIRRFINEDPIKDSHNWYAYVGGNPIIYLDPSGLTATSGESLVGTIGSAFGNYLTNLISDNSGQILAFTSSSILSATSTVGLCTANLTNITDDKIFSLDKRWSYRWEAADPNRFGDQEHMHLFESRGKQSYVQNADGSNHHPPKGGSGPPNKTKKRLKEKTGWDWEAKEKENAERAKVKKGSIDGEEWIISYADGAVYTIYYDVLLRIDYSKPPSIDEIVQYYYKANTPSIGAGAPPIYIPIPNPMPQIPVPNPIPIPIFG